MAFVREELLDKKPTRNGSLRGIIFKENFWKQYYLLPLQFCETLNMKILINKMEKLPNSNFPIAMLTNIYVSIYNI